MNTGQPIRNSLQKCIDIIAFSSIFALLVTHVHAQQSEPFRNTFDTLPIQANTFATAQEGYIVIDGSDGPFKVGLIKADFQSQMRNDSGDIPFQYWTTRAENVVDLEYSIDTELKQEGDGSLNFKFKRGNLTYYAGTEVDIFFPPIDARDANVSFWLRNENDTGQSVYVYLLDEMFKPCEAWAFYGPAVGQWQRIEISQGKLSGATRYLPDKSKADEVQSFSGDITRVTGLQITMNAYSEDVAADYRLDDLVITPAPRTFFSTVMEIEGECRLRPEAGADGMNENWFDLKLDDADWQKTTIPNSWDQSNNPVAWYRIRFTLSEDELADLTNKPVYLLFKGVSESTWVWLNGQQLGSHNEGRDQPFAFDITEHLKAEGENMLVVKVLNREGAGGIWRRVSIVTEQYR